MSEDTEIDMDSDDLGSSSRDDAPDGRFDPGPPGTFSLVSLALVIDGRPDEVRQVGTAQEREALSKGPFVIRQELAFTWRIGFRIDGGVVEGIQSKQVTNLRGKVGSSIHTIGTRGDSDQTQFVRLEEEETLAGAMNRGVHNVTLTFVDEQQSALSELRYTYRVVEQW